MKESRTVDGYSFLTKVFNLYKGLFYVNELTEKTSSRKRLPINSCSRKYFLKLTQDSCKTFLGTRLSPRIRTAIKMRANTILNLTTAIPQGYNTSKKSGTSNGDRVYKREFNKRAAGCMSTFGIIRCDHHKPVFVIIP